MASLAWQVSTGAIAEPLCTSTGVDVFSASCCCGSFVVDSCSLQWIVPGTLGAHCGSLLSACTRPHAHTCSAQTPGIPRQRASLRQDAPVAPMLVQIGDLMECGPRVRAQSACPERGACSQSACPQCVPGVLVQSVCPECVCGVCPEFVPGVWNYFGHSPVLAPRACTRLRSKHLQCIALPQGVRHLCERGLGAQHPASSRLSHECA